MFEAHEGVDLVQRKLLDWSVALVRMLPNLALAALILVCSWLLARLLREVSRRILLRVFQSGTMQRFAVGLVHVTTILIGVFAALSVLHLDKTVTSLLAGAGILGLALGFAFQDIAANFISGILIATHRPYNVGELIGTREHLGVVQRIDLRTTEIRSLQGVQVIIPNKEIFQNVLHNYTRNGIRRVDLSVAISYREDLVRVRSITHDAVRRVEQVIPERDVELYYQGFREHFIELEVRFWIQALGNTHYHLSRSAVIMAIKAAYDKADIVIPLPIRTVELSGNSVDPGSH
jgi:small conductance mechanosensitive channel